MLEVTEAAIHVIKHIAPGDAGLRLYQSGGAPDLQARQVEVAEAPRGDDRVLGADGAHVFLAPEAAEALDDKVLDAKQDERGVRFAVGHQQLGQAGG